MFPSQIEFLKHILDECRYLKKEYNSSTFDIFLQDERLSKAECRSLEIIGEATHKINPDLKAEYPFISWREMSDLRNRIIHHYFGVDYEIIWDTLKTDIPILEQQISLLIEQLDT